MHDAEPQFKLGRHNPGGGMVEHRHPHVFAREAGSEGLRLTIAPSHGHIDLLSDLARLLPGPYGFVYELLDPFDEFLPGRYAWPAKLKFSKLLDLLGEYREFFGGDARHNLELVAADGSWLSYDQHNFIYAQGDLEAMEAILFSAGFSRGMAMLPSPHSHHVRSEFTAKARELLLRTNWVYAAFPEED